MAHEWLLHLVGRAPTHQDPFRPASGASERPGQPVARYRGADPGRGGPHCGLSLPTVRRRWRDGQLPGAYRDPKGHIRVPARALKHVHGTKRRRPTGLSQRYVADALWVLRRVLGFARANGLFPAGFDPTEGLEAPLPDPAAARTRRPTQPAPAAHPGRVRPHRRPPPAVHQMVFWLQRIMGLRISEAFGVLVGDVVDLGEYGMLAAQGQGGRTFNVRDDHGTIVAVALQGRR